MSMLEGTEININSGHSNIVILSDNGVISKENSSYANYITDKINDDNYNIINCDGEFLYKNKFDLNIFSNINDDYYLGKYLGIFSLYIDERVHNLLLKTRFTSLYNENFLNMLFESYYGFSGKLFEEKIDDEDEETSELDVIHNKIDRTFKTINLFTYFSCLNNAIRKGMFRQYNEFEHNDTKIKGRIDVSRQVIKNQSIQGKVCYTTREYTPLNAVNKLILKTHLFYEKNNKKTLSCLMNKYKDAQKHILQLKNLFPNIDEFGTDSLAKQANTKISNMVYKEYEMLRKVSINILKTKGRACFDENDSRVKGVVYDIEKMWSNYIYKNIISKFYEDNNSKIKIKNKKKIYDNDSIINYKNNNVMILSDYSRDFEISYIGGEMEYAKKMFVDKKIDDIIKIAKDNNSKYQVIVFPMGVNDNEELNEIVEAFYQDSAIARYEIDDIVLFEIPFAIFTNAKSYDEFINASNLVCDKIYNLLKENIN